MSEANAKSQIAKPTCLPPLQCLTDLPMDDELCRAWMMLARDGFLALSSNGLILKWNMSSEMLLNEEPGELAGLTFQSFLEHDQQAWFSSFLGQLLESKGADQCQLRLKRKSGHSRTVQFRARSSNSGNECYATLILNAASDVEPAQLATDKKIEAIGLLASGIAHDFNNILTVIDGYAGPLLMMQTEEDPLFHPLQEICSASAHASYLTKQMLAFSKRQVLKPDLLDLGRLVKANFTWIQRILGKDVSLTSIEGKGVHPVWAESGQVAQVLLNLIAYASELVGTRGLVCLETSNAEWDHTIINTTPTTHFTLLSMAISADAIGAVGPPSDSRLLGPEESSVGLAMAKNVLTRIGGFLVEHEDPSKGRVLQAYFPQIRRQSFAEIPARDSTSVSFGCAETCSERGPEMTLAENAQGYAATVLLIEDDRAIRKLAYKTLSENGFYVLHASSAEEALEISDSFPRDIDLMVSDVVLPGMSGTELLSRIRETRPSIRVLLMSGYISQPISAEGIKDEELMHLNKPFTPVALLSRVRVLLKD